MKWGAKVATTAGGARDSSSRASASRTTARAWSGPWTPDRDQVEIWPASVEAL
eukprot:SAG11_NODE_13188_length_666_cov_1.000000_1_plen_52_part_10